MNKHQLKKTFPIILIFSAILIVFYPAIFNQFKADDFAWLYVAKISQDDIRHAFTLDLGGFFRPFNHLLFLDWYYIFGLNPVGYHALNILVFHFTNSVLVYYIVKKLINMKVAVISALVFATLAVHFDSTLFQSGGMVDTGLSTFFTLVSFVSFIKWHETTKIKYFLVSLVVFIFNLLSFESSIILPALLFAYLTLFSKSFNAGSLIGHVKKLIVYAILSVPYLIFQYVIQKSGLVVNLGIYYFGLHFIKNILDYFTSMLIIFPAVDIADISRLGITTFVAPLIKPVVMAFYAIILLAIAFILVKGNRNSKFFLMWFVISILPFSFFTTPIQSRYTYTASIGVVVLLAMFLDFIQKKTSTFFTSRSKIILGFLVFLVVVPNSIVTILIENYKFNNGVSDESVMIDFMKAGHPTFPDGSKIYFVIDSMPFRDLILHMIMSLYYPDGTIGPHIVETHENGVTNRYTLYYPMNYTIFEISKGQLQNITKDDSTYIFDFIKTDYRPGKGVELT